MPMGGKRKRARQDDAEDGAPTVSPSHDAAVSTDVREAAVPAEAAASTAARKRRVIPLVHSQRLRKHSALIHTPTPGLLLCCNRNRETEVMLDTLDLVRLYADRLYGAHIVAKTAEEGEEEEEEDEAAHSSASQSLSTPPPHAAGCTSTSPPLRRRSRFSLASVGGVEGLAFIAFNDTNTHPTAILDALLHDLSHDRLPLPLSPNLYRILPTLHTASASSVTTLMPPPSSPLLPPDLSSPFTFSVVFRHSNCGSIERGEAIRALAGRVEEEARGRGLKATVKLEGSDVAVLCWLVKSVVFLGVVQGYHQRHQLNVVELLKEGKARAAAHTAATAAGIERVAAAASDG